MTLLMLLVLVAVTYEAIRAGTILEQPGYNSDRLFDLNMVGYIFLFYNGRVMDTFKVAKYILSLSQPEIGDIVFHLKLQKLLYYSQGFYLAMYDQPLFPERIEHWDHGPK